MLLLVHIKFSVYACCAVNLKGIHICLFLCNYFLWYMVHWIIKYVGIPFDTVIVRIIVSTIVMTLYLIKSNLGFYVPALYLRHAVCKLHITLFLNQSSPSLTHRTIQRSHFFSLLVLLSFKPMLSDGNYIYRRLCQCKY